MACKVLQLQLADFAHLPGLRYMGSHIWASTATSGERLAQPPCEGSSGVIQPGALEKPVDAPR